MAELLANAAKHAFPDGRAGTVWVELRRGAEGGTEVEVVDDGIGAPEDALTGRPRSAGGLGMRLVENLARRIGAVVRVASKPEQGTRLTLVLR